MPSTRALMTMLMVAFPLAFAACSDGDNAGEEMGDAVEDAGDAIGDSADDARDQMEDAGEDMQDGIDDATN